MKIVEKRGSTSDPADIVMLGSTNANIRQSSDSLLSNELMNYNHDCLPWLYDEVNKPI